MQTRLRIRAEVELNAQATVHVRKVGYDGTVTLQVDDSPPVILRQGDSLLAGVHVCRDVETR